MSVAMTDPILQAAQSRLESQVATLTAEVARLRHNGRPPRRRRLARLLPAALLALLAAFAPLALWAANFQDLHPGSAHNANINAIADAGITRGCFDTAHYCPDDFVTREQMASFLARTAGLGGNPPVTNALTAVTAQTAQTVPDGSVTADKLSATGAAPGQVLVATADGVAWRSAGLAGYYVAPVPVDLSEGGLYFIDIACPDGTLVLAGGYSLPAGGMLLESRPRLDPGDNGRVWRWAFSVPDAGQVTFYTVCATAAQ